MVEQTYKLRDRSRQAKINDCAYCGKVSVVSAHFKWYVCDDCYQNTQEKKKKANKWDEVQEGRRMFS